MYRSFTDNRQQVLEKLSLGATRVELASPGNFAENPFRLVCNRQLTQPKLLVLVSLPRNDVWTDFCRIDPVQTIH